jgi:hypothetical protein
MPFSMHRSVSAIVLLVLLVLAESSCPKKHAPVPVPSQPTPAPAVEAPPQQPAVSGPTTTHPAIEPPPITPVPTQTTPVRDETKYQKSKPPGQPPPPKRSARPSNPAPQAPAPQGPTQNTPPADRPRLGDILPPEQQRQYKTAIDQSLAHAQSSIGSLANRQLTKEQEATVAQVQNFVLQAQETRKADLAAAKSLAERAEVLAHDLVASMR